MPCSRHFLSTALLSPPLGYGPRSSSSRLVLPLPEPASACFSAHPSPPLREGFRSTHPCSSLGAGCSTRKVMRNHQRLLFYVKEREAGKASKSARGDQTQRVRRVQFSSRPAARQQWRPNSQTATNDPALAWECCRWEEYSRKYGLNRPVGSLPHVPWVRWSSAQLEHRGYNASYH
jgi:hypothetical protein